ncbi:MAG: response regulator, partial [Cyanobacteria bacterium J083]
MRSDLAKPFKKPATNRQYLVLIVDDDQDNLLLASYIVESLGMS